MNLNNMFKLEQLFRQFLLDVKAQIEENGGIATIDEALEQLNELDIEEWQDELEAKEILKEHEW